MINIGGNTTLYIIIGIIIIIIAGAIMMQFTTIGAYVVKNYFPSFLRNLVSKNESFQILKNPDLPTIYKNTLYTLLDDIKVNIRRNLSMTPQEMDVIHANIYNKGMDLYDKTENKDDLIETLGPKLVEFTQEELTELKKNIPPTLIDDLNASIVPRAKNFLSYQKTRYKIPILEFRNGRLQAKDMSASGSPIGGKEPISSYFEKQDGRLGVQSNRLHVTNVLTDEVNKDHKGLTGRKPYMGINSNNLITGIRKYGFKNHAKGKVSYDPRGKPKSQLLYLAQLSSTKDPNGIIRSGTDRIDDLLATSRGFSNEAMFNDAYKSYMERTGNEEYSTFSSIKNRFIDPGRSKEKIVTDNIMNNIISHVKLAK